MLDCKKLEKRRGNKEFFVEKKILRKLQRRPKQFVVRKR
jgi:hypothetical protein